MLRSSDERWVVYTPVYAGSPGTRYRVDLLLQSLHSLGFNPVLVVDEKENILRHLYERLSSHLLSKRLTWSMIGRRVTLKVAAHKPALVIVLLDVCAGAARHLYKQGIKTITCVEDLTVSYHNRIRADKERARQVMEILSQELTYSDLVVTPSYVLSRVLAEEYGVEALTVPIGTKLYVSPEQAFNRRRDLALHVGQIHDRRQAIALSKISQELAKQKIETLAYRAGKYANSVTGVRWYSYPSPEDAVTHAQQAFLGIVARYRPAFTLSFLYYHTGLIQPILIAGEGSWIEEAEILGLDILKDKNNVNSITLRKQVDAAERLAIPQVHKPLVKALSKLSSSS